MSNIADQDLITEFVVESLEHMADIESQLLAMETAGENIDIDLVNTVFRAIHSTKGAAGFLGLTRIGELSHNMENVLNLFRGKELVPTTANIDVLLRCADVLRNMLEATETSNDVEVGQYVDALTAIAAGGEAEAPALAETATPQIGQQANRSDAPATGAPATGAPTQVVEATSAAEAATAIGAGEVQAERSAPVTAHERSETTDPAATRTPTSSPPATTPTATPAVPKAKPEASIRVSVGLLDDLMNLAGELVLSRNRLLQVVAAGDAGEIDAVATGLDHVTAELQEAIMRTRMQTIGNVFGKFRRVVRDLSVKLGKDCKLCVEGEDVEVDKSIIEAIGDPLTHLVRNSVDHGIETGEERKAKGKPTQGTISLRAFHQAGKVHISISDDGKGIDASKLRTSAVARGLITAEQARDMNDQEAVRLIFHPGFSMAEKVSDVSGRGVGMDVVRSNIEKLSGTVAVETTLGVGTRIDVRLPLTLAIVPSLIVRCGHETFAVPQASISELVRIRAAEVSKRIERVKQAEMFRLRGILLPLVRLNKALSLREPSTSDDRHEPNQPVFIIVVESGALRYGLIVDGVADSEEIVVKPLGRHLQESVCLAGATVLGDGTVAPILDVTGIAKHMDLKMTNQDHAEVAHDDATSEEAQTTLILRNHPDEQFAIPMQLIARLERIKSSDIRHVGGQEVLQYRDGTLPLLRLENLISASPAPETETVSVVVFMVAKREVGLLIPQLVDIRPISTNVDVRTLRERGVLGSLIVYDMTTRLLNTYELAEIAHPEWFDEVEQPAITLGDSVPRLLVVEDSAFFRTQLIGLLEGAGYEVADAEDGVEAWELLKQPGQQFDLVITDIEMPRLDGLGLTENIRNDAALRQLPVIAVTSLSSDEDIRRGERVGIDAYRVKLEREELLETVAGYLAKTTAHASATAVGTA